MNLAAGPETPNAGYAEYFARPGQHPPRAKGCSLDSEDTNTFIADAGGAHPDAEALSVVTARHAELIILAVQGSIDVLTAPQLSDAVDDALVDRPTGLIVDLTDTELLASAGMTALVSAHDAIAPAGFGIVANNPSITRPMRLVGLDQTLTIRPTLDAAIKEVSGQAI